MKTHVFIVCIVLCVCFLWACSPQKTPFSQLSQIEKQEIIDYFFIAHYETITDFPGTIIGHTSNQDNPENDNSAISFDEIGKKIFSTNLPTKFPEVDFGEYEDFIAWLLNP